MANILLIETATQICSIGIAQNGTLLALRESTNQRSHSELITIFIAEVLKESGISFEQLDAVAVSKGPGSYTGLRIGVSTAKALCYALDIPLVAIETLQSLAVGVLLENKFPIEANAILCPMIDARRMEVYAALFDTNNKTILETEAVIVDQDTYHEYSKSNSIWIFGDGSAKCKEILASRENVRFIDDFNLSVQYMVLLAEKKYEQNDFEDVAYFEPFYLKDFIAGAPKVKGLYT